MPARSSICRLAAPRRAQLMKQLQHPHIVRLLDAYESPTHLCLVMELCTGGELMHRITQARATAAAAIACSFARCIVARMY